jgi:hypothetical protein
LVRPAFVSLPLLRDDIIGGTVEDSFISPAALVPLPETFPADKTKNEFLFGFGDANPLAKRS